MALIVFPLMLNMLSVCIYIYLYIYIVTCILWPSLTCLLLSETFVVLNFLMSTNPAPSNLADRKCNRKPNAPWYYNTIRLYIYIYIVTCILWPSLTCLLSSETFVVLNFLMSTNHAPSNLADRKCNRKPNAPWYYNTIRLYIYIYIVTCMLWPSLTCLLSSETFVVLNFLMSTNPAPSNLADRKCNRKPNAPWYYNTIRLELVVRSG